MANVPWFIGAEGAQHSAEVARSLVYDSTNGAEGVVRVNDCKVTQTGTASGSVQIGAGGILLPNVSPGGGGQSYADYISVAETLAIPATTSGGGRSDLIVRTIEDPQYGGHSNNPSNPAAGPYAFFRRFSVPGGTTSVSALGLTYPAVALARIDLPSSTSTITNAMITDLRKVANPRRIRDTYMKAVTTPHDLTSGSYVDFPNTAVQSVAIPSWAGKCIVRCDLLEILHTGSASTDGEMTLMLGNQPAYTTQRRFDNVWSGATARVDHTIVSSFSITDAMRGTNQNLRVRARRIGGTGYLRADTYSQAVYDVEFIGDIV